MNARDTKNLPGKKTDVQERQWVMKLHTYGLLRNSFRPTQEIRMMRNYWRQRNDLSRTAGRHIQRMQKVLTQMNAQLANVISDLSGLTGQTIVKAILAGERDPHELRLCPDNRISGDKVIGKGRLRTNNRLTAAFKMAATSLRESDTYLGAQFRRLRRGLGLPPRLRRWRRWHGWRIGCCVTECRMWKKGLRSMTHNIDNAR